MTKEWTETETKLVNDKGKMLYEAWHEFVLSNQRLVEDIPLLSHAYVAYKILIDTYETNIDIFPHQDIKPSLDNIALNCANVMKILEIEKKIIADMERQCMTTNPHTCYFGFPTQD